MKTILIIGIGAGDPDYLTVQAVKALNRADVFFLMDKGPAKTKLRALREEICRRHIAPGRPHRFVEAPSPPRDPKPADYRASVDELNAAKQAVFGIETALKALAAKTPQAQMPEEVKTDVVLVTKDSK